MSNTAAPTGAAGTDTGREYLSDGVPTLTLNRPEHENAVTRDMVGRLNSSLRRASDDLGVRAVVLTGAGNAFCAGGDMPAIASGRPLAAHRIRF